MAKHRFVILLIAVCVILVGAAVGVFMLLSHETEICTEVNIHWQCVKFASNGRNLGEGNLVLEGTRRKSSESDTLSVDTLRLIGVEFDVLDDSMSLYEEEEMVFITAVGSYYDDNTGFPQTITLYLGEDWCIAMISGQYGGLYFVASNNPGETPEEIFRGFPHYEMTNIQWNCTEITPDGKVLDEGMFVMRATRTDQVDSGNKIFIEKLQILDMDFDLTNTGINIHDEPEYGYFSITAACYDKKSNMPQHIMLYIGDDWDWCVAMITGQYSGIYFVSHKDAAVPPMDILANFLS